MPPTTCHCRAQQHGRRRVADEAARRLKAFRVGGRRAPLHRAAGARGELVRVTSRARVRRMVPTWSTRPAAIRLETGCARRVINILAKCAAPRASHAAAPRRQSRSSAIGAGSARTRCPSATEARRAASRRRAGRRAGAMSPAKQVRFVRGARRTRASRSRAPCACCRAPARRRVEGARAAAESEPSPASSRSTLLTEGRGG